MFYVQRSINLSSRLVEGKFKKINQIVTSTYRLSVDFNVNNLKNLAHNARHGTPLCAWK